MEDNSQGALYAVIERVSIGMRKADAYVKTQIGGDKKKAYGAYFESAPVIYLMRITG